MFERFKSNSQKTAEVAPVSEDCIEQSDQERSDIIARVQEQVPDLSVEQMENEVPASVENAHPVKTAKEVAEAMEAAANPHGFTEIKR